MSRIIFFVLIVAVIYFAWRSMRLKQIQLEKRLDKQEKANLAEHKNDMPGEKMVSCANCGLYVPISEAVYSNGEVLLLPPARNERPERRTDANFS